MPSNCIKTKPSDKYTAASGISFAPPQLPSPSLFNLRSKPKLYTEVSISCISEPYKAVQVLLELLVLEEDRDTANTKPWNIVPLVSRILLLIAINVYFQQYNPGSGNYII